MPTLLVLSTATATAAEPALRYGSTALVSEMPISGVIFSHDSQRVGIFNLEMMHFWNLATAAPDGTCALQLTEMGQKPMAAADGQSVLHWQGPAEKQVILRRWLGMDKPVEFPLESRPETVMFSESGDLAALCYAWGVRVLHTRSGEAIAELSGVLNVRRFSASADSRVFAFSNRGGHVDVFFADQQGWSPPRADGEKFAAVAVSPDGRSLALASFKENDADSTKLALPIRIMSLDNRQETRRCEAAEWFAEHPNRLRFSPDGTRLFAGDGAYIRGWETTGGRLIFAAEPGWNYPGPIVVSPNGRYVAVAFGNRGLVWEVETGRMPAGFEAHTGFVWAAVFSNDGRKVATAAYGFPQVFVWNAATGRLECGFTASYAPATGDRSGTIIPGRIQMAFSLDGSRVATLNEASGSAGPLRVWDTANGKLLWSKALPAGSPHAMIFTAAGLFVTPGPGNSSAMFDADTGRERWRLGGLSYVLIAKSLHVDRAGRRIAIDTGDSTDNPLIDANTGGMLERFSGVPHLFAPNGSHMTLLKFGPTMSDGTFNDLIVRRDLARKQDELVSRVPMGTLKGRLSPDATLHADEKAVGAMGAFAFRDLIGENRTVAAPRSSLEIEQAMMQNMFFQEGVPLHSPGAAAFSPDGRLFAVKYPSGVLVVWETATGQIVLEQQTTCHSTGITTFSPDGRTLLISDGQISGMPVYGFDMTFGAARQPPPRIDEIPGLFELLRDSPERAFFAIHRLAAAEHRAVVERAKGLFAEQSADESRQFAAWIASLSDRDFNRRESAMSRLLEAGWRVRASLLAALPEAVSVEARERLTRLLNQDDLRPLRIVPVLEQLGTPEARQLLETIANQKANAVAAREARRTLARMPHD